MTKSTILLVCLAPLALAACAQPQSSLPTRLDVNPLGFHSEPVISDGLTEQAHALTADARAIVRSSTVKGAMAGAAVGCGLGALVGSGAESCAKAAVMGAVSGGVMGNRAGKKDVTRRVELASPNGLVRNLSKANSNLETIQTKLPALLARQDAELNQITMAAATNQISPEEHDARVAAIRQDRANLAQALMLTVVESRRASANLKSAAAQGHSGLDWHISATDQLARDTLSARSKISLL